MPQIADVILCGDGYPPATVTPTAADTLVPCFARKNEARWWGPAEDGAGDVSRTTLTYSRKEPLKGQGELIKHTFRVTQPRMKSVVNEGVPYEAPPIVDFVTVCEVILWQHPRSTADDRALVLGQMLTPTATLKTLLEQVLELGNPVY